MKGAIKMSERVSLKDRIKKQSQETGDIRKRINEIKIRRLELSDYPLETISPSSKTKGVIIPESET